MKVREFDIENYNVFDVAANMLKEELESKIYSFGGIEVSSFRIIIGTYNNKFISEDYETEAEKLNLFDKDAQKKILNRLQLDYKEKVDKTKLLYEKAKKKADYILHDDKEYNEILIVLEDNFVCQANQMLLNIIYAKTKGKSVKAMKYQARQMQYNNISCD